MTRTVVRVENLVKEFGELRAVDDLSFEIEQGEFFSIVGPSGCGKSTTLRCIAGFESPTEGTIRIGGTDVTEVPAYKRDTGMVFQGYALFPHKTVGENVGFGLKMQGIPPSERQERVADALATVDLEGLENRAPNELSGGQQQRVALARAIVVEPSVLLLDEPLSNLDLKLRKRMRFELKRIQSELDITTIYVTHDQEEALSMSDRILVMNNGVPEKVGTPHEIYNEPNNEFVADFIGEANIFEGELLENNGRARVQLHFVDGMIVELPSGSVQASLSVGDPVLLTVRPENLEIYSKQSDKEGLFSGTVQAVTFLGKDTRYLVEVGGQEIIVDKSGHGFQSSFQRGAKITLEWIDQESIIVIPEQRPKS